MPLKNIVRGQAVSYKKVQRMKELRQNMTGAEAALWEQLRRNHLQGFHFRRQQIIDGYIVDFYCHASAVVVEVDGEIHEQQVEDDAHRDRVLKERGLRVLRFSNQAVLENLSDVLRQIAMACQEAQKEILET